MSSLPSTARAISPCDTPIALRFDWRLMLNRFNALGLDITLFMPPSYHAMLYSVNCYYFRKVSWKHPAGQSTWPAGDLTEPARFELAVRFDPYTKLAIWRFRPLSHSSFFPCFWPRGSKVDDIALTPRVCESSQSAALFCYSWLYFQSFLDLQRVAPFYGVMMTLTDFLDNFYFPFRPATSPRTIKLYRHSVRKFGQFCGRSPTLADLTNQNVGKYLAALLASGLRPATVEKERCQILAIWRDARMEGLVDRGPRIQKVKVPDPVPRSLRECELRQLWLTFDRLQGKTGGNENRHVARAVATIQLNTAARINAVAQLRWSDIRGQTITFRAETRKGGTRNKVSEVPIHAIEYLAPLHRESPLIFPGCHGTTKLHTLFRRAFDRSGIKTRGKTSHLFRSTKATEVKAGGGDATAALDHDSPATTNKSYIDKSRQVDDSWRYLPFNGLPWPSHR